jgi:hypothetical protein
MDMRTLINDIVKSIGVSICCNRSYLVFYRRQSSLETYQNGPIKINFVFIDVVCS